MRLFLMTLVKPYRRSRDMTPHILNLRDRQSAMVDFLLWLNAYYWRGM